MAKNKAGAGALPAGDLIPWQVGCRLAAGRAFEGIIDHPLRIAKTQQGQTIDDPSQPIQSVHLFIPGFRGVVLIGVDMLQQWRKDPSRWKP